MVNYVDKIATPKGTQTLGGAQFDDGWVWKSLTLTSSLTLASEGTKTFSLSSYLPNDGYDYMVQILVYLTTGTKSGDAIDCQMCSGSTYDAGNFYRRATRCLTRTASARISACTVELPVLASDKAITIKNGDGNGTGTYGIYCASYKRLGTNGKKTNYIEKIKIPNNELTVGGDILDGKPVAKSTQLLSSVSIASDGSQVVSLADWLPNDGHDYICYFNLTTYVPAKSGNSVTMRLSVGNTTSQSKVVCRVNTRSAYTHCAGGNIILQISGSNRNVTVYNTGGAASTSTQLYARAYRRVGTNKLNSKNYISNINGNSVGGSIADGQWVPKWVTIFGSTAFPAATGTITYTISNYLPTNNELYEVQFATYSRTGSTSSNVCSFWVAGNGVSFSQVGSYVLTRTNSSESDAKSGVLICKQDSNGKMTVSVNKTSSQATGNCGFYLTAYRRIGTNA